MAHAIVRAMEECEYSVDDADAFLRRVKNVEYGLSAEVEFGAVLRWLGACPFVHRLQGETLADKAAFDWLVPDLLAVFKSGERTCSVVIEVKTTARETLRIKPEYVARLEGYARLVSKPLLLAWRPRNVGSWLLVDPLLMQSEGVLDGKLEFADAVPYDLMSVLAGDLHVVPRRGAGLFLQASRVSEKRATPDGYEAEYCVDSAQFRDAEGQLAKGVPDAIVWTIFASLEEHQNVTEQGFSQSFVATGGATRAQDILRTAASFRLKENEQIDWKAIGVNLDAVLSRSELGLQLGKHFGSFIQYVLHQRPRKAPSFLPDGWSHASRSGQPG